ncbi:MAG: diguanylate cyclase, partial [Lysobacteraceae bacterium]
VADRIGNLWLTSNRGVMRVARKQLMAVMDGQVHGISVDLYGETDGMVSSQCNGGADPAALLRNDGSIWVATAKGASIIRPERLQNYRREPPQTVLEEVRVNDQITTVHGMLDLAPGTRKIDVRYFALSYHLPKQIRYRYRLDGFDNTWSIAGQRTSVQFTNLPPGNYRLHIQAAYPGGDWSQREAGFGFRIQPFFWQRPWVIAIAIAMLILAAWLAYQARIRQIAANQRRLQHLVDERTEDLRLQTKKLTRSDAEKSELLELLRIQSEAFERQAREDTLTGLANRRRVDEAIEAYFSESRRSGRPLGFAIMDIDFFKRINDRFSHASGDAVLREIGAILREHQRPGDLAARLGGEEFVCILAGSDLEGARGYCERMRLAIAGHDWTSIAPDLAVTISIGVVVWTGEESYSRLSSRADELLYRAKDAGRNRVES